MPSASTGAAKRRSVPCAIAARSLHTPSSGSTRPSTRRSASKSKPSHGQIDAELAAIELAGGGRTTATAAIASERHAEDSVRNERRPHAEAYRTPRLRWTPPRALGRTASRCSRSASFIASSPKEFPAEFRREVLGSTPDGEKGACANCGSAIFADRLVVMEEADEAGRRIEAGDAVTRLDAGKVLRIARPSAGAARACPAPEARSPRRCARQAWHLQFDAR